MMAFSPKWLARAGAAFLVLLGSLQAQALYQQYTIVNRTGATIYDVYVEASDMWCYSRNPIDRGSPLLPGQTRDFSMPVTCNAKVVAGTAGHDFADPSTGTTRNYRWGPDNYGAVPWGGVGDVRERTFFVFGGDPRSPGRTLTCQTASGGDCVWQDSQALANCENGDLGACAAQYKSCKKGCAPGAPDPIPPACKVPVSATGTHDVYCTRTGSSELYAGDMKLWQCFVGGSWCSQPPPECGKVEYQQTSQGTRFVCTAKPNFCPLDGSFDCPPGNFCMGSGSQMACATPVRCPMGFSCPDGYFCPDYRQRVCQPIPPPHCRPPHCNNGP